MRSAIVMTIAAATMTIVIAAATMTTVIAAAMMIARSAITWRLCAHTVAKTSASTQKLSRRILSALLAERTFPINNCLQEPVRKSQAFSYIIIKTIAKIKMLW